MTPNEIRTELSNLALAFLDSGLAATVNIPVIANHKGVARVTWPAAESAGPGFLSKLPYASITEYRHLVLGNHFIALMRDGALFQVSVDLRGNDIVGHRFGYYPCPILLPEDFDALDFDALDLLLRYELEANLSVLAGETGLTSDQFRMRSPLRFDYAPHAKSKTEPASHMHMMNSESRVAVHGPLSIGHFVQFVLKHFYRKEWDNLDLCKVTRWPLKDLDRTITEEEEECLHLTCRRL